MPGAGKSMRAVLLKGHGDTDQLEYRTDVPVPSPGPRGVLNHGRGAGNHNTDINMRIGWYSKSVGAATSAARTVAAMTAASGWAGDELSFPRIQGADAC